MTPISLVFLFKFTALLCHEDGSTSRAGQHILDHQQVLSYWLSVQGITVCDLPPKIKAVVTLAKCNCTPRAIMASRAGTSPCAAQPRCQCGNRSGKERGHNSSIPNANVLVTSEPGQCVQSMLKQAKQHHP